MRYAFYHKLIPLYSLINMLLVNTPTVPNKAITEVHGIARGSTVRARENWVAISFAGLKTLWAEKLSEYTNTGSKPIHANKFASDYNGKTLNV